MHHYGYLNLLFGSFFRWWWALITGFATLIAYVSVPSDIILNRVTSSILILIIFTLLFLCVSTVYQGKLLYQNCLKSSKVISFHRSEKDGEHLFIIENTPLVKKGNIAELKRFINGVEVSFALVEIVDVNSKGQLQAKPLWISPGHLRDLKLHTFQLSDIRVDLLVQSHSVSLAIENREN